MHEGLRSSCILASFHGWMAPKDVELGNSVALITRQPTLRIEIKYKPLLVMECYRMASLTVSGPSKLQGSPFVI